MTLTKLYRLPLLLLLCITYITLSAQQQSERLFVFGHSLVDHRPPLIPTPSDETTVPHWLHLLAEAAGHTVAVSGKYGFLPQHINLPPFSQWGYDIVTSAWESDTEPFSAADFSTTIITPGNFIQYQPPTEPYFNEPNLTPISATETIFDWVEDQEAGMKFLVYENWPDMGGFLSSGFPPSPDEYADYHNYTRGEFHDWWLTYQDSLLATRSEYQVRMVPVGPIMADLLESSLTDQVAITDWYEDDAPHGRANLYFLAAMITYSAIYAEPVPAAYQPPSIIHQQIRNNYAAIASTIWDELLAFNDENGNSRVFYDNMPPAFALLSFTGALDDGQITLDWSTGEEGGADYFLVQRKAPTDAEFIFLANVDAEGSNSNYSWTDTDPLIGENQYRLGIGEPGGELVYTDPISVLNSPNSIVEVRPDGSGRFGFGLLPANGQFQVFTTDGRMLQSGQIRAQDDFWVDLRTERSGAYLIQLMLDDGRTQTFKLIR